MTNKPNPFISTFISPPLPSSVTTHQASRLHLTLSLFVFFSRTTRSRRARSRRRTRCTPPRYGATGWWPRRCPRAPSSPPAPSAPAPSSAGYLEEGRRWEGGREGDQIFRAPHQSSATEIRCYTGSVFQGISGQVYLINLYYFINKIIIKNPGITL